MVTIEQIAQKADMPVAEVKEVLKKRGVSPREGEKYSGIDLEMVFDENFKVRDANAPILRTMKIHQDFSK